MQAARVTTNGIGTAFALTGPGDAPVVALGHSLGSSMLMWEPQLEALEARYRVLRYDTRGHGGSDAPEGAFALEQLADDFVALLDALDIEQVHFVGLSMGGMVGQALALDHAARVRSLALCATMARVEQVAQPLWQQRMASAREQGMASLCEPTMQRWFTAPFLAQAPPMAERIREQFRATPVAGFIGCCEAIRRLDFMDDLGAIAMPCVVVVGAEDQGTPVSASEAIAARVVGSRLFVIPEAAHLCNVEQAARFNDILLSHLDSIP